MCFLHFFPSGLKDRVQLAGWSNCGSHPLHDLANQVGLAQEKAYWVQGTMGGTELISLRTICQGDKL